MARSGLLKTVVGIICIAVITNVCVAGEGMHPYPLWPSEPVPGWPGVGADSDHTVEKLTGGIPAIYGQPEFLAYSGAVHHVRREYQRYNPPYPIYNQNTLIKNFVFNEMKGFSDSCVEFEEPVYYNPMYGRRSPTQQKRSPVKAYPWTPASKPIKLTLGKLKQVPYTIRPICAAPSVTAVHPRKFIFVKLRINDWPDDKDKWNAYILRAQSLDNFYVLQQFHFHARADRVYKVEFSLLPESEVDLLLYNIDLHARNAELANRRGKRRTILVDTKERAAKWAEALEKGGERNKKYLASLKRTPEEQKEFDDFVWKSGMEPLNCHFAGWAMWFKGTGRSLDQVRLCPVPAEWEELVDDYNFRYAENNRTILLNDKPIPKGVFRHLPHPFFFRTKSGKLYKDSRNWLHTTPPRYEIRGLNVYERVKADKGGYVPGKLLGPLSDFELHYGKVGNSGLSYADGIVKDGKVLGSWREFLYRDGRLYKDGKLVNDEPRKTGGPWTHYYGERLRTALIGELQVEPGTYYDAAARGWWNALTVKQAGGNWCKYGDRQTARDLSMKLVRHAYGLIVAQQTDPLHGMAEIAGSNGPDRSLLKYYGYGGSLTIQFYDHLFEFIDGNKGFAEAVGRYMPGVDTPDEVIAFLDTYLVQYFANLIIKHRHFTDHGTPALLMTAVLVQDDTSISDPWMEFLFRRSWEYPQALSGLGDNLVTGGGRDGGSNIGSFFYGRGGQMHTVKLLEDYLRNGGNPKYDLTDPRQYPNSRMTPYFSLEASAAGRINLGIGDVGGPAEYYGRFVNPPNGLRHMCITGWRWHKDPRFAWELVNTYEKEDLTDSEWAEIVEAAKSCPRDPFLMNKSRVISNWGGYVTINPDSDDYRFMREATLRVGTGWGHAHSDTLDLRLFAFGGTMVSDFNQRPAYGRPKHQMTRCHNLVEVDEKNWMSHAWIRSLFDAPGSPYMDAESVPPAGMENVHLFRRQIALVDADMGRPSQGKKLDAKGNKVLDQKDPDVILPSSYLFDVFRVSGGTVHTYCFHGCVDDGFEVNVKDKQSLTHDYDSPDDGYLRPFHWFVKDEKSGREGPDYWAGRCDENDLVATWRLDKKSERTMLRGAVPTAPPKYTRLTLFDQKDSNIMHGIARDKSCKGYYGRCLYAQKKAQRSMDTVFVALIEPYAGEPSIIAKKQLDVVENEKDALKAVAVEVKTRNGHTDLLFADGRPEKAREVRNAERGTRISAEYAYLSTDDKGLRQATVTGGKLLETSDVKIEVETASYGGTVSNLDYLNRVATVNSVIPARLAGHFFEVGGEFHKTSYEVNGIKAGKGQAELSLRKGLEIMRTRVRSVDPAKRTVVGAIAMFQHRGRDAGLVASDDNLKKFWRVAYTGGDRHAGHIFELTRLDPKDKRPVFTEDDFPAGAGIRVWEFGVGDTMSIRTGVSLRRVSAEKGAVVYEVYATSPCTITLRGKRAAQSRDNEKWTALKVKPAGECMAICITEEHLAVAGRLYIKVATHQ